MARRAMSWEWEWSWERAASNWTLPAYTLLVFGWGLFCGWMAWGR